MDTRINFLCNPTSCPSGEKLCKAGTQNWCCPKDSVCITYSKWPWKGADCGKTKCGKGETQCTGKYSFSGGVICCNDAYEYCEPDPKHGYPLCEAKGMRPGYTWCQGKGEYTWRKRWCEDGKELCAWQPNGYPICFPVKQ